MTVWNPVLKQTVVWKHYIKFCITIFSLPSFQSITTRSIGVGVTEDKLKTNVSKMCVCAWFLILPCIASLFLCTFVWGLLCFCSIAVKFVFIAVTKTTFLKIRSKCCMTKMDIDIERSVKATAQIFQSICSPDHFSFFMFDSFFVSFFLFFFWHACNICFLVFFFQYACNLTPVLIFRPLRNIQEIKLPQLEVGPPLLPLPQQSQR